MTCLRRVAVPAVFLCPLLFARLADLRLPAVAGLLCLLVIFLRLAGLVVVLFARRSFQHLFVFDSCLELFKIKSLNKRFGTLSPAKCAVLYGKRFLFKIEKQGLRNVFFQISAEAMASSF